jgi:hypothetical protein
MPRDQKPVVIEFLHRTLDVVGNAFDEIQIWPLCPSVDRELYEAIPKGWQPKTRMIPFLELMRGGLQAAPGDGAIVSRFHAHLLLARLGVSGLFIDGQNCEANPAYYRTKHASLQLAGSGWMSFTQLDPRDALAVFAKGCSAGFESRNRQAKAELYSQMLQQITK